MREIFINYRRVDTMGPAMRLFDDLGRMFGTDSVFMDSRGNSIPWGADWDKKLKDTLATCEALVVLIGPQWTTCERQSGLKRLAAPDDWVRNEIATVLGRSAPLVLPVLLGREEMPPKTEVPEDIWKLYNSQAYAITDERWPEEAGRLVSALNGAPQLKQLYDLESGENGIRLLEQLILKNRSVANAVIRSQDAIAATDQRVDGMRLLKNVHDALHEIESNCLIPIRNELEELKPKRTPGETIEVASLSTAQRRFRQKDSYIRTKLGELAKVVPSMNNFLQNELSPQLGTVAQALGNAAATQKTDDYYRLVGTLERLAGSIPMRVNDEINTAMSQLELQQLLDLTDKVKGVLDPAAAENPELKPMFAGIAALKELRDDLFSRVRDHTLLQSLDSRLRSMFSGQYQFGTWDNANPADLLTDWNDLQLRRQRVTGPFSPVFEGYQPDLEGIEAQIKTAFASGNKPGEILKRLYGYANEIGEVFREVDSDLNDFCTKLREKTQLLKTVLEQIEPEPENA